MKTDPYLETYSGHRIYVDDPEPWFDINDIAWALSNLCRYGGHCRRFYSVAEHSLLVSSLSDNPLEGLLHDATEAMLSDVVSPFKALMPEYRTLEDELHKKIARQFGLPEKMTATTHRADLQALFIEADLLTHSRGRNWIGYEDYSDLIGSVDLEFYGPGEACEPFIREFQRLTKKPYKQS